jgi:hypothetical protein
MNQRKRSVSSATDHGQVRQSGHAQQRHLPRLHYAIGPIHLGAALLQCYGKVWPSAIV